MIGSLGTKFDRKKIKIERLPDKDLKGIIDVDMITGNHFPIISRKVAEAGIFPNKNIFFGFEELEFCLRVKEAGFRLLIDGNLHKELREVNGCIGYKISLYIKKNKNSLWREYYSTRGIMFISKKIEHLSYFQSFFYKIGYKISLSFFFWVCIWISKF